ncbi:SLOG family protein [Stieleria tagensis]|uniref:SLOG family protein n=1 Tax=Stieleria tagensis TaxID=2956795 RepID=UPI00209B7C7B|nr:SLOG family protein [Stieleria tagensis]
MKVIIAGSRSVARISSRRWDYDQLATILETAIEESGFQITGVISGGAGGPDRAGEQWAARNEIPVAVIKPNWKLGRGAGLIANRHLAEVGEALIAIHDGESTGTQDMIDHMQTAGMPVHVVVVTA